MIHILAGPNCAPSVLVERDTVLPAEFTVQGNYPNPFRSNVHLRFDLPWPARVALEIFDVTGRLAYVRAPVDYSAG